MLTILRQSVVSVLILLSLHAPTVTAQSATVTTNVLLRTFMVRGKEIGTIFSIDVDGGSVNLIWPLLIFSFGPTFW
jgi:hypothetical protein